MTNDETNPQQPASERAQWSMPAPEPGPRPYVPAADHSQWAAPAPARDTGSSSWTDTTAAGWQPQPGGAYPPASPGSGDQLSWGPPASGRGLSLLLVIALMVLSAVGGGIAGASLYAQTAGSNGGGGGAVTRVIDAPQLDYTSLGSIASQVSPSVVSIRIGEFGGSGVVMSEDGYILTNAHVVEVAGDRQVMVRFSNGTTASATVVGADRRSDIAVIRAEGVSDLTPASFGNSDDVVVGDTVLAIGSPLGYEGSVTQGIVSALDRTLRPDEPGSPTLSGLLQTDAAINRGNSGGALVNLAGEVVGINTAIAVANEDSGFLGLGFAVPSNRATSVAERLIGGEEISHAFLGVRVAPAEGGGAVIGEVTPGSPAAQAGLREGDVLLRLGDRQITDANDVVSTVQAASAGDTLEVEFRRGGATQVTTVTLGEAPD